MGMGPKDCINVLHVTLLVRGSMSALLVIVAIWKNHDSDMGAMERGRLTQRHCTRLIGAGNCGNGGNMA